MTSMRIGSKTSRLVAQCFNQLRYRILTPLALALSKKLSLSPRLKTETDPIYETYFLVLEFRKLDKVHKTQ
jgi:hypothetical protein